MKKWCPWKTCQFIESGGEETIQEVWEVRVWARDKESGGRCEQEWSAKLRRIGIVIVIVRPTVKNKNDDVPHSIKIMPLTSYPHNYWWQRHHRPLLRWSFRQSYSASLCSNKWSLETLKLLIALFYVNSTACSLFKKDDGAGCGCGGGAPAASRSKRASILDDRWLTGVGSIWEPQLLLRSSSTHSHSFIVSKDHLQ